MQDRLSEIFSSLSFNTISGEGRIGIAASGIVYQYVLDALGDRKDITLLKIGTPYPFPQQLAVRFLSKVDRVLVIEELDPIIEEALIEVSYLYKKVPVYGKKSLHFPKTGEYSLELVDKVIKKFLDADERELMDKSIDIPPSIKNAFRSIKEAEQYPDSQSR